MLWKKQCLLGAKNVVLLLLTVRLEHLREQQRCLDKIINFKIFD